MSDSRSVATARARGSDPRSITDAAAPEPPARSHPYGDRRGERVTIADRLVSGVLWGVGAGWLTSVMSSLMLAQIVRRSDQIEWLNRLYCRGQVALTGSRWRAVVHPDVDPEGVYMFAQNHTNHFDHVAMYPATPHYKQGLELETHFKYPFYGWFMKQRGTIPVPLEREGRAQKILAYMREEVAQGHSLLVFPEGTRTLDGRVGPFKLGVIRMARDLGIPIAPVAVTGMYDVMRKGSWLMRPGYTVTVFVEKPVPTEGVSNAELPALAERVRKAIAARVDAYFEDKRRREAAR